MTQDQETVNQVCEAWFERERLRDKPFYKCPIYAQAIDGWLIIHRRPYSIESLNAARKDLETNHGFDFSVAPKDDTELPPLPAGCSQKWPTTKAGILTMPVEDYRACLHGRFSNEFKERLRLIQERGL